MKERLIRRYANRKMYDVKSSRYVSLADLAEMIRKGEYINVTNKSGDKNYTAQVLRQIILEQGKESDAHSVSLLHEWVRMGSTFLDNRWDELRSGMEEWFKKRSGPLINFGKRDELDKLKMRVADLEKKINDMNKRKTRIKREVTK